MDALFNEDYKEEEKKKQGKGKKKQKKQDEQTTKKLDELFGVTEQTCNENEPDGFNLDEDFLKECEEYNQNEEETHCCECTNIDCDMHPMHLMCETHALVSKDVLPLHIGGYLADEILSSLYRSLAELIEAKDLTDEEDDEIRKILEEVGYRLVHAVDLINASRHNIDEIN